MACVVCTSEHASLSYCVRACVYSIFELVSQVIMVLLVRTIVRGQGAHRFEVESPLHLVSVDHAHLPEHILQSYMRL